MLIVPTKAATTIINSILQVNRAVSDFASKEDLKLIFRDIIFALNEVVFDQMKAKLIISQRTGYDLLCDELDYLLENLREFFTDKNGMSVEAIRENVEAIKQIKKVFLDKY